MTNQRKIAKVLYWVLLTLLMVSCIPAASPSLDATTVKDTKEEKDIKQIKPDAPTKLGKMEQQEKTTISQFAMGKEAKERKNPYADAEITTRIIPSNNNTFGYDILISGRSLMQVIHQPNIPGLPGNEGFSTREKAQKVADFVVNKIRNNEMPPIVKISDLKALGVLE